MINLREALTKELEKHHSHIYFQQVGKKEIFPYIVYDLPNSFSNENQEVFVLDIDIWDNRKDTTELELLSSEIWKALNKLHYIDENIQFTIYRSNRLPELDEKKPELKRRKLIFEIRYFDRSD